MMLKLQDSAAEKLREIEARLRGLREEKARAVKVADAAKASADAVPDDQDVAPQFEAAKAAVEAVKSIETQIEQAQEEQIGLLRQVGGPLSLTGVNGWEDASRRLSLERGEHRADMPAGALMRPMAQLPPSPPSSGVPSGPAVAAPSRYLYPVFAQLPVDGPDAAVTDFTVSVDQEAATGLTGIERPSDATTPKAELPVTVGLGTPTVPMHAITADSVPNKVFDHQTALRAFLESEMRRRLDKSLDAHCVAKILAANPPNGSTGSDLISQVRNAVSVARDLYGSDPAVLALSPTAASALDLTQVGADNLYLFLTRDVGSASPLWSLRIVEVPGLVNPIVIDPVMLGVVFAGIGSIWVDPYTGMHANTSRLRVEVESLFWVRNADGAFVVSA